MSEQWWHKLPEPIAKAYALSHQFGMPLFENGRPSEYNGSHSPCIPSVGRLLASLAASKTNALLGEMGTACGVSASWMAMGMDQHSRLISAELDPQMAAAAAILFIDDPRIEIREGDWQNELVNFAPFDLMFMDSGIFGQLVSANWPQLTELVKIGGFIVMDDLLPTDLLPESWTLKSDRKRQFAFSNPKLQSTELMITSKSAALLCTRIA